MAVFNKVTLFNMSGYIGRRNLLLGPIPAYCTDSFTRRLASSCITPTPSLDALPRHAVLHFNILPLYPSLYTDRRNSLLRPIPAY